MWQPAPPAENQERRAGEIRQDDFVDRPEARVALAQVRTQYFSQPASLYQARVAARPSSNEVPATYPSSSAARRVSQVQDMHRASATFSRETIPGFPLHRAHTSAHAPTAWATPKGTVNTRGVRAMMRAAEVPNWRQETALA